MECYGFLIDALKDQNFFVHPVPFAWHFVPCLPPWAGVGGGGGGGGGW
jgi:hypothetical protein